MLSRPASNRNRGGWGLSLCTNLEVSVERMIELCSMRWSIEVFFKESKQHLGHLAYRSGDFVSNYTSIPLSAIRYSLLLDAALSDTECDGQLSLADFRNRERYRLTLLGNIGTLWKQFTHLRFGLLDHLTPEFGSDLMEKIKLRLGEKLDEFIEAAFQIDFNSEENPSPQANVVA